MPHKRPARPASRRNNEVTGGVPQGLGVRKSQIDHKSANTRDFILWSVRCRVNFAQIGVRNAVTSGKSWRSSFVRNCVKIEIAHPLGLATPLRDGLEHQADGEAQETKLCNCGGENGGRETRHQSGL